MAGVIKWCEECGVVEVRGRKRFCDQCAKVRHNGRDANRRSELKRHGLCPYCKAELGAKPNQGDGG